MNEKEQNEFLSLFNEDEIKEIIKRRKNHKETREKLDNIRNRICVENERHKLNILNLGSEITSLQNKCIHEWHIVQIECEGGEDYEPSPFRMLPKEDKTRCRVCERFK